MPTAVLPDSKKTNVGLRQLRFRAEQWDRKYADIERAIEEELKSWLEKHNNDLPTYLDLKRGLSEKLYQYSDTNLQNFYNAWRFFVGRGLSNKFQLIDGIFIAPK